MPGGAQEKNWSIVFVVVVAQARPCPATATGYTLSVASLANKFCLRQANAHTCGANEVLRSAVVSRSQTLTQGVRVWLRETKSAVRSLVWLSHTFVGVGMALAILAIPLPPPCIYAEIPRKHVVPLGLFWYCKIVLHFVVRSTVRTAYTLQEKC